MCRFQFHVSGNLRIPQHLCLGQRTDGCMSQRMIRGFIARARRRRMHAAARSIRVHTYLVAVVVVLIGWCAASLVHLSDEEIYERDLQTALQKCQLYASSMPALCQLYASSMPALCQLYASSMPALCQLYMPALYACSLLCPIACSCPLACLCDSLAASTCAPPTLCLCYSACWAFYIAYWVYAASIGCVTVHACHVESRACCSECWLLQ